MHHAKGEAFELSLLCFPIIDSRKEPKLLKKATLDRQSRGISWRKMYKSGDFAKTTASFARPESMAQQGKNGKNKQRLENEPVAAKIYRQIILLSKFKIDFLPKYSQILKNCGFYTAESN